MNRSQERCVRSVMGGAIHRMLPFLVIVAVSWNGISRDLFASGPDGVKQDSPGRWKELPCLPDPTGFAGPFAGVSGDALIVAGGANFPTGRPWDGHPKVWHQSIFVLESPDSDWKRLRQTLPGPLAYGAALTLGERLICCGGGDAQQHSDRCFSLSWDGSQVRLRKLPDLPGPNAFFAAASNSHSIYIVGGMDQPDSDRALQVCWTMPVDAKTPVWSSLPACPGSARMLATLAADDDALFVVGGARLYRDTVGKITREFLRDCWKLDLRTKKWSRIADLPQPVVAAPNPAFRLDARTFAVLSGDSGQHFNANPPLKDQHPGFPAEIYQYDQVSDRWARLPDFPKDLGPSPDRRPELGRWPPVTTNAVFWKSGWVVPSGEIRPGVRSNRVWYFEMQSDPK